MCARWQVKRGATFEEIRQMSDGQCVALHLPIISAGEHRLGDNDIDPTNGHSISTHTSDTGAVDGDGENSEPTDSSQLLSASPPSEANENSDDLSIPVAYDREFNLPQETRDKIYAKEMNRTRRQLEGQASLERHRPASARIFQVIVDLRVIEYLLLG